MVKISTKIDLEVSRKIKDLKLESKIPGFKPLIRLIAQIKFNELDIPEDAIIDTGAHISVIPFYLWKKLKVQFLAEHKMRGIIPNKECEIPVMVGKVKAKIVDHFGNDSKEIDFLAYLVYTNKVPLIIGMRDLLEKFDLYILFSQNKAFLEELN